MGEGAGHQGGKTGHENYRGGGGTFWRKAEETERLCFEQLQVTIFLVSLMMMVYCGGACGVGRAPRSALGGVQSLTQGQWCMTA